MLLLQRTRYSLDPASLLGVASRVNPDQMSWVGGYHTGPVPATGWSWLDNTNSSGLNCGSEGCGPWSPGHPNDTATAPDASVCMHHTGLTDVSGSDADNHIPSFTCEVEVCPPGTFLGLDFTSGCEVCPVGRYSVGGAVGTCPVEDSFRPTSCADVLYRSPPLHHGIYTLYPTTRAPFQVGVVRVCDPSWRLSKRS